MVLAASALSALLALGQATPAAATLELSWAATPACSSREEVTAEVARLLRATTGEPRSVRARAVLGATEGGAVSVNLELEIAGISHPRSFVAESCQAAKSAIALIVAIAINPAAAQTSAESGETSKEGEPTRAATSSPSQPAPAAEKASTPAPRRVEASRPSGLAASFSLALGGVVDAGTLPNPTPGAELALGFRAGHLRLEAAASLFVAQTATERTSRAGASFSPQSAELRVGFGWELGSVWVGSFGAAGLTRLHAAGQDGSVANFDNSQLMPALGAGGLLVWALAPPFGLRLSLEGLVPTYRPKFVVSEPAPASAELVHQPSPLLGRALIGAMLQFP